MKLDIYITSVQPLLIDDAVCFDLFFITRDDPEWKCLRIYNYFLSFMVARFPGMNIKQFTTAISQQGLLLDHTRGILHKDLRDSAYFQFDHPYEYLELIHRSPKILKMIHTKFVDFAKMYYSTIKPEMLSPYDYLFWNNTEQPFRFVSTSTQLNKTHYDLACKYLIPLIGGATLDLDKIDYNYPEDYLPTNFVKPDRQHMFGLNANKNLRLDEIKISTGYNHGIEALVRNENVSFFNNVTILSYDIETFTKQGDNKQPIDINAEDVQEIARKNRCCEIMTIGIGMFHLNSNVPFERYCLITKDINDSKSVAYMKRQNLSIKIGAMFKRKTYDVQGEYDKGLESDITHYIICESEEDLLKAYIDIMNKHHPHIVTAFNNFIFDDRYLFQRMLNYSVTSADKAVLSVKSDLRNTLVDQYLNAYSPYKLFYFNHKECKFMSIADEERLSGGDFDVDESSFKFHATQSSVPFFNSNFVLKIDNEAYTNQKTIFSPHVINTDVYKLFLKADAKRFTQAGHGTLNNMLEVYGIHNPYTHKPLSKTDMKIDEMFRLWEKNVDIYRIGLYCTQDAWICGTLIVECNKFIDLIEMATMSNTTFKDSVYRADGIRVSNCILGYGFHNGFAVMDNTLEERESRIKENMCETDKLHKKDNGKFTGGSDTDVKKKKVDMRPMGNKTFDPRTIVGGQVRQIKAGREFGVVASDYSSMYPSNKEASNVDSSSRVPMDVVKNLEKYNLKCVKTVILNDMYGIGNDKINDSTTDEDLDYIIQPRHKLFIKCVK